jgi:hypothetical protein
MSPWLAEGLSVCLQAFAIFVLISGAVALGLSGTDHL